MPTWQELAGQQGAATCGSINEEFAWAVKTLIPFTLQHFRSYLVAERHVLENPPSFHDKVDLSNRRHILQRIAGHGHQVSLHSGRQST